MVNVHPLRVGRVFVGVYTAVICFGAVGCSADKAKAFPVAGKIAYKGTNAAATKLAGTRLLFEPVSSTEKIQLQGVVEDDGTFSLGSIVNGKIVDGVLPGEYKGRLVPPKDDESGRPLKGLFDPRFENFDKSGIRLTVSAANPDFVIEVDRPRR